MIILSFFFAMIFAVLAIIVAGSTMVSFYDPPSIIAVGASVWLFLVASGRVAPFFNGIRKSFSFRTEHDALISDTFAKLCWFTPLIGIFWTIMGALIILHYFDPAVIGSGCMVALITTFYALFLTLFLFAPIANRFRKF